MVLPDGTRSEPRRPGSRRAVGVVAVLALVGGMVGIGMLTAPEPEPETVVAPTSITSTTVEELERPLDLENFSVDQIAIGEPLKWERAAGIDDLYARELVLHKGVLYLFGWMGDPETPRGAPIVVWRSSDGYNWESLGAVLETEYPMLQISSTPQGLIMAVAAEAGMTIWRSDDAITWESEQVRLERESEHTMVFPTAVAGDSASLIVMGSIETSIRPLIEERLAAIQPGLDMSRFDWGNYTLDGELYFTINGPVGLTLLEVSAEDLGLTQEEVELFDSERRYAESELNVWAHHKGLGWQQDEVEGVNGVDSMMFVRSRLFAFGYGGSGSETLVSDDGGLHWNEFEAAATLPYVVTSWGDRLIGLGQGIGVSVSPDGSTWELSDLTEHFPGWFGWRPWALAAGDAGIALVVEGWDPSAASPELSDFVLRAGDWGNLTLDSDSRMFHLNLRDESLTLSPYQGNGIEVDLDTQQVHFHHPETGELLASVTIDELVEAEASIWRNFEFQRGQSFQAFVFSPDAERWTIQGVEEEFGPGSQISWLEVTDDSVVALIGSFNNRFDPEPGLEIWTAPIP